MTFASIVDRLHRYAEQLNQLHAVIGTTEMAHQMSVLQQFFSQNLWAVLTQVELPQQQAQWHSATTEIHRHMRLLSVEISFVQLAQQGPIRQQRIRQIEQRLEQLQGFTQVLLNLLPSGLP